MKSQLLFFVLLATLCFSFSQPLCDDTERTFLLQFKESVAIERFASMDSSAYPKTDSWGRNGSDCCVWDGVECNEDTGHVIGLNLSSSFLYSSITSNSSLFRLTHLERLNLADNHFNASQIPSSIILTYLNLSLSSLSGQIPYELLSLSRLSSLDLSSNGDPFTRENLLRLKNPAFPDIIKSLTRLKQLALGFVDISAELPETLANISSLEYIGLNFCRLKGAIPSSIGKLQFLRHLDLSRNRLDGQIPSSLANLTQLEYLKLSLNDFESGNLSWIGSFTRISYLSAYNLNLTGPLPSSLGNITRLVVLNLHDNQLSGPIPLSFAGLVSIESLRLHTNVLEGEVDFDIFLSLKNLNDLQLSHNRLSLMINPSVNKTLRQFTMLELSSCNLTRFPSFLRHQKRLEGLALDNNRIGGNVPKWFWNMSTQTLEYLNFKDNFLTGHLPPVLPFVNLFYFIVSHNSFTGLIPIPRPSLVLYEASFNAFSREIPTAFCKFDSGRTPFSVRAPQVVTRLEAIDLRNNKLQGKLPFSLGSCTMLVYLNLEDNKLHDVFPHWLGTLPKLQVLLLGSNRFYGEIVKPKAKMSQFSQLRIIVLAYNNFSGALPSQYFQCLKAMQASNASTEASYSNTNTLSANWSFIFYFPIIIKIKGVKREYDVINEELSIMDLSHNNFIGQIPETIASLEGLLSLDLSSNNLSSHIPTSLESLSKLESLDLSANKLSGAIPQKLTKLNFLQYFNVSYNNLTGPIPQAGQLGSFPSTFYEGNTGLCGIPLQNKCEASEPQPSSFQEEREDPSSLFNFGWKVVAIGYGCGFLGGVFIGKIALARRPSWFAMIFRVRIFK